MTNHLIFGKNDTQRVVSVEPGNADTCTLFVQSEGGAISQLEVPLSHWLIYTQRLSPKMQELAGNQPYKWLMEYDSAQRFNEVLRSTRERRVDVFVARDTKEAFMLKEGVTMYKGLRPSDVSILSFDIETTGLTHDKNSKVLLISNTFRKNGVTRKRLFSFDDYQTTAEMFVAWCAWVRECDPSIITGHNIFGYDLPYIRYCAGRCGAKLALGRDHSEIKFDKRVSFKRKDGSQAYEFHNAHVYGREVVDTFFLAINYDVARNYESYGLKQIIKQEGLEKKDRAFYDASTISQNYKKSEEWVKIKAYAIDDADDALALFDLMIPPMFYATQSIPRSLQHVINSTSGSQINGIMVRGYLQQGHSIAKSDEAVAYEGAISFGVPGVHKNVLRFDVASLYPSVMRQYRIYNQKKDPQALFLQMVNYFTEERLANKKKAKDTGDRYYKDLEQSQKIMINSQYGFLGMGKANYNYPEGAASVTRYGREILKKAILWATGQEYEPATETSEADDVA